MLMDIPLWILIQKAIFITQAWKVQKDETQNCLKIWYIQGNKRKGFKTFLSSPFLGSVNEWRPNFAKSIKPG